MEFWKLIDLHEEEVFCYNHNFLGEVLRRHPAFHFMIDWLENYDNLLKNRYVLDFAVPKCILEDYFEHSYRVYYIENYSLQEYFLEDLVVCKEDASNQPYIAPERLLKAKDVYYNYGGISLFIIQDKARILLTIPLRTE